MTKRRRTSWLVGSVTVAAVTFAAVTASPAQAASKRQQCAKFPISSYVGTNPHENQRVDIFRVDHGSWDAVCWRAHDRLFNAGTYRVKVARGNDRTPEVTRQTIRNAGSVGGRMRVWDNQQVKVTVRSNTDGRLGYETVMTFEF